MKKITLFLRITMCCLLFTTSFTNAQVGIGTTAPNAELDVRGDAIFNEDGAANDFRIESLTKTNLFFIDGSTDQLIFNGAAATAGDIFSVFATGTHNATNPWLVNAYNSHSTGGSGFFQNTSTTNGYNAMEGNTYYTGTTGIVSAIFGLANGASGDAIGVRGASNSSDGLGVYGTIPTAGSWLGFGGLFTGGLGYANGLYNLSDARAKRDIVNIDGALDKILNIEGFEYKYDFEKFNPNTENNNQVHYGFMAQNVKQFLPHAVALKNIKVANDTQTLRSDASKAATTQKLDVVDYTAIVPVLVEAMKEQQNIINAQNAKIKALEDKVDDLINSQD